MSTYNVFKKAVSDYRYLKNRNYADKSALKLVGDHYRFSKVERNCLRRGVVEKKISLLRKKKLLLPKEVKDLALGIDWYNVLITIESYLKGFLLFLADDGIVRDTSAIHGSYKQSKVTEQAIEIIIKTLGNLQPSKVEIVIDSPISHSKKMADELSQIMESKLKIPFTIFLARSADFKLKRFHGVIASSDSVIIDAVEKIFDLSRFCLSTRFNFEPLKIEELSFKQ
jgi:hypothetical protein